MAIRFCGMVAVAKKTILRVVDGGMMNKERNDYGELVIAVGAPGSIERVRAERPALIERLNNLYWESHDCYGRCVDEAIKMIRAEGIHSKLETRSLLAASAYSLERDGSVTKLVMSI